jgi:putative FmdB family regulatory protein
MPTYAYECQACGTQFEQYQKFTDAPLTKCPNCKKNKVRRVFSPAAIVFKGSGWYKTDSRSKSPATPKNAEKPAEATAEKTAEAPAAEKSAEAGSNGNGSSESKAEKPKKEKAASKASDK